MSETARSVKYIITTYGRVRLQHALRTRGLAIGEKRVRRLMRAGQLHGRRRRAFRVTTDSAHAWPVVGNHLARRFRVAAPNRVWAADITALPTHEGWAYLAVVLDLYARRVVGWAVDTTLETRLVLTAVTRALATRRVPPGLIHHSDRGSQYASAVYQALLTARQVQPSMSRVGDCWDNAPVESFFSGLKREAMPDGGWATPAVAQLAVADHIDFYNRRRLHSANDYRSPMDAELALGIPV
jgi:transposase InsO family protein